MARNGKKKKNTTPDSINISLKLYFNIKVKGDFKYLHSVKNFNQLCCMNIKSQVPNSNYTTQTEGGLPVIIIPVSRVKKKFTAYTIICLVARRILDACIPACGLKTSISRRLTLICILRLWTSSEEFARLRNSSGIFGNNRVVFKNPSTPRIKISRLYLRKNWQVYACAITKMAVGLHLCISCLFWTFLIRRMLEKYKTKTVTGKNLRLNFWIT